MRADILAGKAAISLACASLHLALRSRTIPSPPASAPADMTVPSDVSRSLGATHRNRCRDSRDHSATLMCLLLMPLVLVSLPVPLVASGETSATPEFQLTDTCPASFENQDGGCVLRNRYREYRSLRDAGVGGLKTGLPPLREGLSLIHI